MLSIVKWWFRFVKRVGLHPRLDHPNHVFLDHFLRDADHVFECLCMRDAVANDHWLVDAQDRNATVLFKFKHVKEFILDIPPLGEPMNAFCQFEDDVAGKAIANHHI